jgi:hypothetical protein
MKTSDNNVAAVTASVFSIVFSLSLIKEISSQENNPILLAVLISFTILFLIYIEVIKVKEMRNYFSGARYNVFILSSTLIISIGLSCLGIFLWLDKTNENNQVLKIDHTNKVNTIIQSSTNSIDSLLSIDFSNSVEYKSIKNELDYWKKKSSNNIKERELIRSRVYDIQHKLDAARDNFEKIRNRRIDLLESSMNKKIDGELKFNEVKLEQTKRYNFITIVFFVMILLTELIIIYIAKETGEYRRKISQIKEEQNSRLRILTEILLRKQDIVIGDIANSPFIPELEGDLKWEYVNKVNSLFSQLKLSGMNMYDAQSTLNNYYNKLISIY